MLTDDEISEILLPLMPLKDPYVFARAVETAVLQRRAPVTRTMAVEAWRAVCGSDQAMAAMLPPTGRMLEEFARRIADATRA